jgi:hypothetical protein
MDHLNEHHDHTKWQLEHAFWLDEMKVWKSEHRHALSVSKDLELAYSRFEQELDDLERHIFDHETQISVHEGVIAQASKPAGAEISLAGMEALHDREISVHAAQVAAFERIRMRHQQFMKGVLQIRHIVEKLRD